MNGILGYAYAFHTSDCVFNLFVKVGFSNVLFAPGGGHIPKGGTEETNEAGCEYVIF
jgi:hypothetical protein